VLESYSFHKQTVESTQLDTPRCIPEKVTALQNINRIMQLHCANIHHFSVLRNIHIGKFTHIGMQKKQPHALRALLSSHPPKDLDDTAVHTATHATQAAVISHQNTGIL